MQQQTLSDPIDKIESYICVLRVIIPRGIHVGTRRNPANEFSVIGKNHFSRNVSYLNYISLTYLNRIIF